MFIIGKGRPCVAPIREAFVEPEAWFTQEVITKENHVAVLLNGKKMVDYDDRNNEYKKGAFMLLCAGGQMTYRKVEVMRSPKVGS